MRLIFAAAFSIVLLCQCQVPLPGRVEGIDPNPFEVLEKQARPENRDPKRVAVPMLRSTILAQRWGSPKLLVGPQGGYALRYENPRNRAIHLTIYGSPDMYPIAGALPPPYTDLGIDPRSGTYMPREVPQSWKAARLEGRSVRFHLTEARAPGEPVQYSTETFRLTGPDGRTASYRLRAASARGADDARALFETASF
jgi:hypothetical protein